ncbi:MAG: hypothetical protein V4568_16035 [Pseudomonadota bacterium]
MNRTIDSNVTEHPTNSQLVENTLDTDQTSVASVVQDSSSLLRAQMQQMEKTIANLRIAQTKIKNKNDN